MGSMTDYLEEKLLNHVFRSVTYTPPETVYLALYTASPNDAGGGTEVTGGSYARPAVTFSVAVSPDGRISNNIILSFTNMPACDIISGGMLDDPTAGNLLMYGDLVSPRTVVVGTGLSIPIGDLNLYFQ